MVTDQLARAMRWSVCCGVLLSCAVPAGVAWADVDQAPPIIRGSGDLWFADGGSVQGDPYDLRVQAEDADQGGAPASGVRSVEVRADGVLLGQRQGGCGAAGCTVGLDVSLDPEQYPEGPLEIEIVAEDAGQPGARGGCGRCGQGAERGPGRR